MPASKPNAKPYKGRQQSKKLTPKTMPIAPDWRKFGMEVQETGGKQAKIAEKFQPPDEAIEMVNYALTLRRPLLITGNPGTGKSSLAYAVAEELGLGAVLKWAITTRTMLKDGLYDYDAIARLQDAQLVKSEGDRKSIGEYITLGPLGTAFLESKLPRVLLIDEIDKSDIDLPNDLLNLFEDGEFVIRELQRENVSLIDVKTCERDEKRQQIERKVDSGVVRCTQFPLVIMTSNGERDFPPPFLRRCLQFKMPNPDTKQLQQIVTSYFDDQTAKELTVLIASFCDRIEKGERLATDQLLGLIHVRSQENSRDDASLKKLQERLLKDLNRGDV
jgi:MoxR-like ATPase